MSKKEEQKQRYSSLAYTKYNTDSAPADAEVEPEEMFEHELDDENQGVCLMVYLGGKENEACRSTYNKS